MRFVLLTLIRWIVIYPVDSVIQLLNNRSQVDNTIPWINHYPVDSVVCFVNIYPLDSDLSSG